MEYCPRGDLRRYLNQRILPAEEAQNLTYQILEGLHQMHENNFAHRDLKPGVSTIYISSNYLLISLEYSH
jgi:serine/threonine protein kinase